MEEYELLRRKKPDAERPVLVIGSEVHIPGGSQEYEVSITLTEPEEFRRRYHVFRDVFLQMGAPFEDVAVLLCSLAWSLATISNSSTTAAGLSLLVLSARRRHNRRHGAASGQHAHVPHALISQYFSRQYERVVGGQLWDGLSMVLDRVCDSLAPYAAVCGMPAELPSANDVVLSTAA